MCVSLSPSPHLSQSIVMHLMWYVIVRKDLLCNRSERSGSDTEIQPPIYLARGFSTNTIFCFLSQGSSLLPKICVCLFLVVIFSSGNDEKIMMEVPLRPSRVCLER